MATKRLNADDAFKSIMGKGDTGKEIKKHEKKENEKFETDTNNTVEEETQKDRLFPTTIYITEKQRKAMKIKTAVSGKPEDKDLSSIVRAALDMYLSDVLEGL